MRPALLWSLLWTVLATAGAVAALLLANFGGSRFLFGLLLLVPLTVGLPTTAGLLLVTSLWSGPPLWLFAMLAVLSGFGLQAGTVLVFQRLRRSSRARASDRLAVGSEAVR